MKIGKRLQQLQSMVTEHYDHIWDCCCDHGLLGTALMQQHPTSHVHFVDVVQTLITSLENKLNQHYACHANWRAVCMDAGSLPVNAFSGRHLIIIAGVGGDLMMEMVASIKSNHPGKVIDFLLCPVHHQYALRSMLIEQDFHLKNECLVEENRRFYEVLFVSTHQNASCSLAPINHVGSTLWITNDEQQKSACERYLASTLAHYQRIHRGQPMIAAPILDAYASVTLPALTIFSEATLLS